MIFSKQQRCPACGKTYEFVGFSNRIRQSEFDYLCPQCQEKHVTSCSPVKRRPKQK